MHFLACSLLNTLDEDLMIPWHRLFGLGLTDLYHGTSYRVELEKDLSLKQQMFLALAWNSGRPQ